MAVHTFPVNSFAAQKRRKDTMDSNRGGRGLRSDGAAVGDSPEAEKATKDDARPRKRRTPASATGAKRAKLSKFTLQYNPERPMTKEETAEWRRQQRKERNRASAAASRERIRSRITELEGEVDELRAKYAAAIARIGQLESERVPQHITKDEHTGGFDRAIPIVESAEGSPSAYPQDAPQIIPSHWTLHDSEVNDDQGQTQEAKPHLIETTSRQA